MPLSFLRSLSILEISLIQIVGYSLLWFYNEYVATMLTFVMAPIFLGILIISAISDMVERSKVGRKYYIVMAVSVIIPILVALFFMWAYDGEMDYLKG